ncbi:MAG: glutamyl-tRNA amidotransferase [Planctomycetota bacterium]|nr:MAG: glutamyl-tRNA amidotransferase [Planctomycetota bacterium]
MLQRLTDEIKQAMRDKAKLRLQTLRSIMNDFKNSGIEKKGAKGLTQEVASPAEFLDESEMVKIIQGAAKRRREAAEQFVLGDRPELAAKEEEELTILQEFLPEAMGEDELKGLVAEAIAEVGASSMADMGKVMAIVKDKVDGRAEGGVISAIVRGMLG